MKLWLNGQILDADKARIDPADRGILLGDGLFETMVAENGEVPELRRHFSRLSAGAELLRLNLPIDEAGLAVAIKSILTANEMTQAALRLTITRGVGPRGLLPPRQPNPTMLLTTGDIPQKIGPVRLITSRIRRDESSPFSAVKTINYLPGIMARIEADELGADDAVLLNHAGYVAEASAATIFAHVQGIWITPPVQDGALPGICRARLLEAGRVREQRLSYAALQDADAICIGNIFGLGQVLSLDGRNRESLSYP